MTRRLPLMITALLVVVASLAVTRTSSASFVATTSSSGTVTAAADWTPPTVSVTAPTSPLRGTAMVTAVATDADSGIANVTIQRAVAGGSAWTTICTTISAPFSCAWSTTSVADGLYDLRATAVDKAGLATTSALSRVTVTNAMTVVLARPGDFLRGTVSTTTSVTGAGATAPSVRVEYAPAGTTNWSTLCRVTTAPYTCSASTTSMTNRAYDFRSVAVAGSTTVTSAVVTNVMVDNAVPTVTMTNPGTPLKGTKTFQVTAADTHSGVAKVVIQARITGSWSEVCTATTNPFSCSGDTKSLPNGTYTFRAIATDRAGNSTTSTTIRNRVVQNTVSSVILTAPSTYLRGTPTITATATTNGTISSVKFQGSIAGAANWTDICTDTRSPYTCSFATTQVADGTYDLRAVVTDDGEGPTASPVVANRIVDNTAGRGVDIQTTNGGTAGKIDTGDTIVFTFSERMDLSSVYDGWSGNATSGTVQIRDGLFSGGSSTNDTLELSRPSGADLGTVYLKGNFASNFSTLSTAVTLSAATVTEGDVVRTVVTLRIDGGSVGNSTGSAATMTWSPAADLSDLAGNPINTTSVTESGTADLDF